MIQEITRIFIIAGHEAEFETGVAQAKPLFLRAKGCHGIALHRSIEHPQQYTLVVDWETVELHMVDFRESDDYRQWRKLVESHMEQASQAHHETRVL